MHELWVEKYRPKTLDDYVWIDDALKTQVNSWITNGATPNLLLSGQPGTGKTSLARMVLSVMGIPKGDILDINASRERKIEDVQDRIMAFASTYSLNESGIKYVILDEADSLSPLSQRFLRAEIEKYHEVCRFIFTCNFRNRISPALHSRLQEYNFQTLGKDEFIVRAGQILVEENVDFEYEVLEKYVANTYPDLRKCINLLQQNTIGGKLEEPKAETDSTKDYMFDMVEMFSVGKYLEARKLLIEKAQEEEYVDIYRFFYENLDLWGDTEEQQDDALLIIRKGIVNHGLVADIEINLAAVMVELTRTRKGL